MMLSAEKESIIINIQWRTKNPVDNFGVGVKSVTEPSKGRIDPEQAQEQRDLIKKSRSSGLGAMRRQREMLSQPQ